MARSHNHCTAAWQTVIRVVREGELGFFRSNVHEKNLNIFGEAASHPTTPPKDGGKDWSRAELDWVRAKNTLLHINDMQQDFSIATKL